MITTITEALAELNTLHKRVEKKRESITSYLWRPDSSRDPLERQGGAPKFIAQETQAMNDLLARHLAIRMAIQRKNLEVRLSVGNVEMSVAEWLTWRKEQAPEMQAHFARIRQYIEVARKEAQKRGGGLVAAGAESKPQDVVVNIDEKALAEAIEAHETTLGTLDGKLSLINATTTIEV